jgi:hypothetical protein
MNNNLIIQARKASIVDYLLDSGKILLKEGHQFRVKNYAGLIVSGNMWYSHTLSKGGNTLDFLIEFEHFEFKKAVELLSTGCSTGCTPIYESNKVTGGVQLVVPERNTDDKRVLAYLIKTRGLCIDVVIPLIKQGRIYEAMDNHNCIFTGIDEELSIRYAMQRSSIPNSDLKFESKGSDKRYSFSLKGTNDILCVFESPIDLLSYMSIYFGSSRLNSHMLSLGGTSDIALESYIKRYPGIRKIVFCIDNDKAGLQAFNSLSGKYSSKSFKIYKHIPVNKDWNLQLAYMKNNFVFNLNH